MCYLGLISLKSSETHVNFHYFLEQIKQIERGVFCRDIKFFVDRIKQRNTLSLCVFAT